MKVSIFAVSKRGYVSAIKIKEAVVCRNMDASVYIKSKFIEATQTGNTGTEDSPSVGGSDGVFVIPGDEGLDKYVGEAFTSSDALIFICAVGIAVRMIAPYLKHKSKDPAVLVTDEEMRYCIPILSGHLGGANRLACELSEMLKLTPVITTASDLTGLTAVDMFAKMHGLAITDYDKAKDHTAALLAGGTLYVANDTEDAVDLIEMPEGYVKLTEDEAGSHCGYDKTEKRDAPVRVIRIAYRDMTNDGNENELLLIPRCIKLGVGCRRGTSCDKIRDAVGKCLKGHGIYKEAVQGIYSIDLKKDEQGLKEYAAELNVPFMTYSADELKSIEGDFTGSEFVDEVTGVDNVCERSAMMTGSRLLVHKEVYDGVTVAVSV